MTAVALRPPAAADLAAIARSWREGWVDGHESHVPAALVAERTPASFDQRALATGTVPVPAHRYEREVGNRREPAQPLLGRSTSS